MTNRMVETMFGYSGEELLELSLEALVPERFRQTHVAERTGYLRRRNTVPWVTISRCPAGAKTARSSRFQVGLSHMLTQAGMLAIAFVTDLTERRQTEAALRESEERFSLFMSHLPAAAFMKDMEGRYVYVNPGFAKLVSLPPPRCVSATDHDFWPSPPTCCVNRICAY